MGELSDHISDAEREQMVVSLREHLLAGRLTLDEFSGRVETTYKARTGAELVKARERLPDASTERASRRKPTRITTALFGDVERRGRLRLRRRSFAVSLFADLDLDLREAEIDEFVEANPAGCGKAKAAYSMGLASTHARAHPMPARAAHRRMAGRHPRSKT